MNNATKTIGKSRETLKPTKPGEMRILLVDDDREDTLYLCELLEESFKNKSGLSLDSAVNFKEAMDAIIATEYDLVILDYSLGYQNGLDVQQSINKERPNLPIVFITGQGNERVAVSALKHGAIDYLVKDDLSVVMIHEVLEKVFNKHGKALIEKTKMLFLKDSHYKLFMTLDHMIPLKTKFKKKFLSKSPLLAEFSTSFDKYFQL